MKRWGMADAIARTRWPRGMLLLALAMPPVLGLIFEPGGLRYGLAHQARSLLAIWIYVMSLAVAIQLVTDRVVARWPGSLDGRVGLARHVALVLALVAVMTALLARPLAWTCPGLDGRALELLVRGLALGTIYLLLGRLYQSHVRTREEAAAARARADQQLAEVRYAALVSRTQPHFLHNALSAVAGLLPADPQRAETMLRDLGSLFREVVQGTEKRTVRAADELETARRYLAVQQLRFAPRLVVDVESDPLAGDELVPPLVLLPLVENAVLHGLSDGGTTTVRVALALEADHVRFTVANDGPGDGASKHEGGTGLGTADVRARLATLYGDAATLASRPFEAGAARPGMVVDVRVPREAA